MVLLLFHLRSVTWIVHGTCKLYRYRCFDTMWGSVCVQGLCIIHSFIIQLFNGSITQKKKKKQVEMLLICLNIEKKDICLCHLLQNQLKQKVQFTFLCNLNLFYYFQSHDSATEPCHFCIEVASNAGNLQRIKWRAK